jgi:hypothetical protein
VSFGNNDRNPVTTGILRDVLLNLPTLHPKCEAAPDVTIKADKCPSMLGELAKKAIDNKSGFC